MTQEYDNLNCNHHYPRDGCHRRSDRGCSWSSTTSLGSDAFQSHDHQILQLCHHNRSHHYCQDGCHQIPDRGGSGAVGPARRLWFRCIPVKSRPTMNQNQTKPPSLTWIWIYIQMNQNLRTTKTHVESGGSKNGRINEDKLKLKKKLVMVMVVLDSCGRRSQVLNICPLPNAEKSTTTPALLLLSH